MNGVPVPTLREYDFSDEKLRDSVGIRSPKLAGSIGPKFGSCKMDRTLLSIGGYENPRESLRTFVGI
jgi:hypothetical protein